MTTTQRPSRRMITALSGALAGLMIGLAPSSAMAAGAEAQLRSTGRPGSDWLGEINFYRASAGLPPVSEQPAWTEGLVNHLVYLANTPPQYFTGEYVSRHTENPASPYYTPSGATEGASSDLSGAASSPVAAIDGWLVAPFHAIGMLRPKLTQVAFAMAAGNAGLDVIQGLDYAVPDATVPILFPGPGMTTDLLSFGGESPNPLETCGWQDAGEAGLPLIALLTAAPDVALSADLVSSRGTTQHSGDGTLCIVDEYTFRTSDAVYGPTGASILSSNHAVFVIPRQPLRNGSYVATIHQPGQADVAWQFTTYLPPPVNTLPPRLLGRAVNAGRLSVSTGTWSGEPTTYAHLWLRCDGAGGACRPLPASTSDTYSVIPADVGSTLRVQEIADNRGGPGQPVVSAPTPVVVAAHPAQTTYVLSRAAAISRVKTYLRRRYRATRIGVTCRRSSPSRLRCRAGYGRRVRRSVSVEAYRNRSGVHVSRRA